MWLNHSDRVSNVALSPDGTALGSSSWDGTLKASNNIIAGEKFVEGKINFHSSNNFINCHIPFKLLKGFPDI